MASEEFEYYTKANLSKYRGKYVVILGKKVVASGDSAFILEDVMKEHPNEMPLLAKVPKEGLHAF